MIKAYFDGACEPVNPGGTAAFGALIIEDDKVIYETSDLFKPEKGKEKETSNNLAEYCALEVVLVYLLENKLNHEEIEVLGDSKLVIHQMFGDPVTRKKWNINGGIYEERARACLNLVNLFPNIRGRWIRRENNTLADNLSKRELKKVGVVK
jgi:ribonuclease HI